MKLRNQFLSLSLATLLVPWFGWKLLQELEQFLRAGQENGLRGTARTLANALPLEHQARLLFASDRSLPLRPLQGGLVLDGYPDEWPEPGSFHRFTSPDGKLALELLAAEGQGQVYLYCRVYDLTPVREVPPASDGLAESGSDGVVLFLRTARGLNQFEIHTAAPGPLLLDSAGEAGGQIQAYWAERADGYDLELALPPSERQMDLSLAAIDYESVGGQATEMRVAGTIENGRPSGWLTPTGAGGELQDWLSVVAPPGVRAWVVDTDGWVLADSGPPAAGAERRLTWAERELYRLVAGGRTAVQSERETDILRFDEALVQAILNEGEQHAWGQDPESARVYNTVGVPIVLQDQVRGAVVLEQGSDGLLLVTNRSLGRLLLASLLLVLGLTFGLWFFATRLSQRVRRLGAAVSNAMEDASRPRTLPMVRDSDELGELARNNERLLRAVADYTHYLRKLASRLSHELQTPLAITRSSLENLASEALPASARPYLERAREGLERQASIVRAMSEANRLESAVQAAEWEVLDPAVLLTQCAAAYRGLYASRELGLELAAGARQVRCAPDLLVQALDKLVDNAMGLTTAADQVSLVLRDRPGYCEVCVRNTGTRLPDHLSDQLFDSLVSFRERDASGTHLGLGLHIVRLVAEAHGGTVEARNLEPGPAVEFLLRLPLAD